MALLIKKGSKKGAEAPAEGPQDGADAPTEAVTSTKGTKASTKVLEGLQKAHGKGIGSIGGSFEAVGRIQTGIFPLDLATGGGFPQGRSSIIFGPESSGKTVLLYLLIAAVQRMGLTAVLVDLENSHDPAWAAQLGVDCKKLVVILPDNAEQCVDAVEAMIHADDVGIIALDSLAMLVTQNEIEKGAEVAAVGGASALLGKMYRKIGMGFNVQRKKGFKPLFVAANQIRHKIGVMYGDPETMPGGNIPKFSSSMTVRIYGKKEIRKEVNANAPAVLHVSGIVRKWKVPIVGTTFEYDMALMPHEGLKLGEVDAWNTVSNRLKALGILTNDKSGWHCLGKDFKTLELLHDFYAENPAWALKARQLLFDKIPKIGAQQ